MFSNAKVCLQGDRCEMQKQAYVFVQSTSMQYIYSSYAYMDSARNCWSLWMQMLSIATSLYIRHHYSLCDGLSRVRRTKFSSRSNKIMQIGILETNLNDIWIKLRLDIVRKIHSQMSLMCPLEICRNSQQYTEHLWLKYHKFLILKTQSIFIYIRLTSYDGHGVSKQKQLTVCTDQQQRKLQNVE